MDIRILYNLSVDIRDHLHSLLQLAFHNVFHSRSSEVYLQPSVLVGLPCLDSLPFHEVRYQDDAYSYCELFQHLSLDVVEN